jgi:dienelactone hydrolase
VEPLDGFEAFPFTHDGATRTVYRRGRGPGVVVMHEIPGITPQVAAFARRVADEGFTVYLPHLFGTPGRPLSMAYMAGQVARACISREFAVLAKNASSPLTVWLRALALVLDAPVVAPVLSQPSLPFGLTAAHRAAPHASEAEMDAVRRLVADGGCVLGLRFTGDPMVPAERFAALRDALGDGFAAVEIDSSPGNPWGIPRSAHSVLTTDLVDREGHPTRAALDRVLELFRTQLRPAA